MENIFEVQMLLDVKVPMKDGVNLSTDIYLPKTNEKSPTVLMRTPYSNNTDEMISKAKSLAKNGYACVMQDCRGRWDSEGVFYPFIDDGEDGFITQEFFNQLEITKGKFVTGPLTNLIFDVVSRNSKKLKISINNNTIILDKRTGYIYQPI